MLPPPGPRDLSQLSRLNSFVCLRCCSSNAVLWLTIANTTGAALATCGPVAPPLRYPRRASKVFSIRCGANAHSGSNFLCSSCRGNWKLFLNAWARKSHAKISSWLQLLPPSCKGPVAPADLAMHCRAVASCIERGLSGCAAGAAALWWPPCVCGS